MYLRDAIVNLQPNLVAWRRHLHQNPELGFQEHDTAAFISSQLAEIPHQGGIAQTGIVATIKGALAGPTIAIRADMDALPIQETNTVAYRSQRPQTMHACGHDGHVAIAIGVARLLWQQRPQLRGTVKVIFQPAEEGPGGAQPMIEAGVVADVAAIFGLHLWNTLPVGTIGIKSGFSMANANRFKIYIQGKGGHGALPQQTVDAVVVGSAVVQALQTIVARRVNPLDSAVVSIGRFRAGDTYNVIAGEAELWGTARCFTPELATQLPQMIEQVVAGVCATYGASYHFEYLPGYPAVDNDAQAAELMQNVAIAMGAHVVPEMTLGGEDMAYFLHAVPGCYAFVGSANSILGLNFPHHHPCFDFDETALGIGAELLLGCIECYTGSQLTLAAIRAQAKLG